VKLLTCFKEREEQEERKRERERANRRRGVIEMKDRLLDRVLLSGIGIFPVIARYVSRVL